MAMGRAELRTKIIAPGQFFQQASRTFVMSEKFHPGQRWISESEPELGLGSVRSVTPRTVIVEFRASAETREYALDNAPLRRVRFRVGDTIASRTEAALAVQAVLERAGLVYYQVNGTELCETELSDAISFSQPDKRLLAGQVDPSEVFDLRVAALEQQHRRRKSPVRGFVGGRIDLIPHQLYLASEVAGRLVPRVLLADEVGLGKTIEACLILHRLILTGRAQRVLILVPDSLVHQWFVELLRRFNLWFHIFDEERCDAIETANADTNPFLDDQLVLASLRLFTGTERRTAQALAAGWDLLVVDEAHHLGWTPEAVSPEYALVEALGGQTPGLLLLTATPEQLGMTSHFARLRLLDPDRFYDLNEFIHEAESYRDVARLADKLLQAQPFTDADVAKLALILADTEANIRSKLKQVAAGASDVRAELRDALLDQHGTGRVMFRNTRATISGFPKRVARLCPLPAPAEGERLFEALAQEFAADTETARLSGFEPDFACDVRLDWLAELLRTLAPTKVLLICRTRRKVEAIDAALRQRLNMKQAVVHEGLTLVQRDRNAAWFAEDDGARILICSEIGSEGRNFQFAHHLVMFDLPLDPELLEQRIGRLDRIGQRAEIQLHVPFVPGSPQEVLARWYQEGLNSFEGNLAGGHELLEQFGARVHDLAQDFHETDTALRDPSRSSPKGGAGRGEEAQLFSDQIPSPQPSPRLGGERESEARSNLRRLIAETQTARQELAVRLEQGRDRLLELNSFRPEASSKLVQAIRQADADRALDRFMMAVFDHFSIHVEELAPRTYQLGSAGVFADSFPGLPTEGLTVTCDRQRALAHEEMQFLTWDHPLVTGALDLLLGSEKGSSSFAKWPDAKVAGLYVETVYLLECIAPSALHVDRFLPPTPLRVLVDHRGNDVGTTFPRETLARQMQNADAYALLDRPELREALLPDLIEKSEAIARRQMPELIAQARGEMTTQLEHEITRVTELQKVNRSVRPEEIAALVQQQQELDQHIRSARLRLDAIRLIQRGPM
jgi:ATP-dependent helicase HepA